MRALRGEAPKERDNYELREYIVGNDKFNEYYRRQFVEIIQSEEEFEEFKKTLVEKLPVTFRVNPGLPNYQTVVRMFQDPNFLIDNAIP
jgi:16S rRNA C967 or C1407 C5-methylase (RsmB/RsmF family)